MAEMDVDALWALWRREQTYYDSRTVKLDASSVTCHVHASSSLEPQEDEDWTVTPDARSKMAVWGYDVMDHFEVPREIAATAMYYIDRMVEIWPCAICKVDFQLLSVAAFFLSAKLLQNPTSLPIHEMARITKTLFSASDIAKMEFQILSSLQWNVHPPLCAHFLHLLMPQCPTHERDTALFMMEVAVIDAFFCHYRPSEITVAALGNVLAGYGMILDPILPLQPSRIWACRSRLDRLMKEQQPLVGVGKSNLRTSSPVSVQVKSDDNAET